MARDFFTYFCANDSSRLDLYRRLKARLAAEEMRFSGECMRLEWNDEANQYVLSYDERTHAEAHDALVSTASWPGVVLEYDAPLGDRSVYFWNDEIVGGQTFGFEDPSGHFCRLSEDEDSRLRFARFIVDLAECLCSPFAFTASSLPRRTATSGSLIELLRRSPDGDETARPAFVVVHERMDLGNGAEAVLARHYHRASLGDYRVFTDRRVTSGAV